MPITLRSIRTLAAVSTAVLAVLALAFHLSSTQASHDPGAMAAMAIDMDPGASPANTATSLGAREFCARINENGTLDADEDAVDAVQFDVTADGIPPETAMIAYSFRLVYDEASLTVQSHDANFLLGSTPGSSLFDASDSVPDADGNGRWTGSGVDVGTNAAESGSGVLDRVTVASDSGALSGMYSLELHNAAHGDLSNNYHRPEVVLDGVLALGTGCPITEPTPRPTPEPTPALPPTPDPGALGFDHNGAELDLANDPATVNPGESVTVALVARAPAAGLKSWDVSVEWDNLLMDMVSCVPATPASSCVHTVLPEYNREEVHATGASNDPLFGLIKLADITFQPGTLAQGGQCATLYPGPDVFVDGDGLAKFPQLYYGGVCVGGECVAAANDDIFSAKFISSLPYDDATNTLCATSLPTDPDCYQSGATVWYSFVSPITGYVEANTFGSQFNTTLSAYSGSPDSLTQIACDYSGFDSRVVFPVEAGQTFFLMAGSAYGRPGGILFLSVQETAPPTPVPTPSPTPSPTPFALLVGDVDCSSFVNSVDSLKILRADVALPVTQNEPCPDIGASSMADADCDGYTNPRDALGIYRYVAQLSPLSSVPGCPPIGTETDGVPNPVPAGGTPTPGPNSYALSVSSANVELSGATAVTLHLSAPGPTLGAYSVDVVYDATLVTPRDCTILRFDAVCNAAFAAGRVRIAGFSFPGATGEADLAVISFQAGNAPGIADINPEAALMVDSNGDSWNTDAIAGSITIESPTPTPTPAPTPVPVVSVVPPPYDPDLMVCLEQFESRAECDGDTRPGATTDVRIRFCLGRNADCTVRDSPVNDALYLSYTAFMPPAYRVTPGSELPVGALLGHVDAEATLGFLNNPCGSRIQLPFTLLNASVDTDDILAGNPLGDTNQNRIPDGAEHYPRFALDALDPDFSNYGPDLMPQTADDVNGPLEPAEPLGRLFAVTAITPFEAVVVQAMVLPSGAALPGPEGPIRPDPDLGYPVVIVLNDPAGPTVPSAYTDICSPFLADLVIFGQTRDNPCTPALPAGQANCFGQSLQLSRGIPLFPCEAVNTVDEDGDGVVNDGCPQFANISESGSECLDAVSNDSDGAVNDGCPQVGPLSEGAFIPDPDGCDSDGNEASCPFIRNPRKRGVVEFTMHTASLPDADGDGIDNGLDTCPYTPNPSWDARNQGFLQVGDADRDGLPDECDPDPLQPAPGSPVGCRAGYTGSDEDQDCLANSLDNCPLVSQLQDPTRPPHYGPGGVPENFPAALDRDGDAIGDACDRQPAALDGGYANVCLYAKLKIGGHDTRASVKVRSAESSGCRPHTGPPPACREDVNGDTRVDVRDIVAVARAMVSRPGRHAWNPAADVNDDGRVSGRDLALVLRAVRSGDCRLERDTRR